MKRLLKKTNPGWYFLVPSLLGTAAFFLLPCADVFRRAFCNTTGTRFTGLENFRSVWDNEAFRIAAKNTAAFIGVCVPLLLTLSLLIALFLYENPRMARWLKPGFLLPMAVPVASAVLLWRLLFDTNGFLNGFLAFLGQVPVDWMNRSSAFWVLVASYLWKNLGYNIILWLASLSSIPREMGEAAQLDGAGELQVFRYITLPNLLPSLFVISVLALLNSFKVFREAYLVAGDYPHGSMYLMQHLFNNWFRDLSLDKMAAGAVLDSMILIALILLLQRAWNRRNPS